MSIFKRANFEKLVNKSLCTMRDNKYFDEDFQAKFHFEIHRQIFAPNIVQTII